MLKKIEDISNLKEEREDKEPDNWNRGTQRTYILKRIVRVWYCSCVFYGVLLCLKGFFPSFKLDNVFIHELFGFICISGVLAPLYGYYFKNNK
jgi:hypothetical protein